MSKVMESGTLCFRVQDEFINSHARHLLIEGEIEKAIDFLKTLTDDENIIADVLFGRKKFVEIGETQKFKLEDDNTTEMYAIKLDAIEIVNRLRERRKEIEELAKEYGIEVPVIQGSFFINPELNLIMQAKKNFDIADRCRDEILHPEIFIDYSLPNPMNTMQFDKGRGNQLYSRKYGREYYRTFRQILGVDMLISFFENLTQDFELPTKMRFITYDPKEFVDNYRMKHSTKEDERKRLQEVAKDIKPFLKFAEMKAINPRMGDIAEKTFERMITGKKTYDIDNPDDFNSDSGFIDKEGNWYSAEPLEHEPFAADYVAKYLKNRPGWEHDSSKKYLVSGIGWIAVTVGAVGVYVLGGERSYNNKQRQTLKKWFKKYQHGFHPIGDSEFIDKVVDGDYGRTGDVEDEKHSWFEGGRA